MTTTLSIPTKVLKAMMQFAAQKDVRYYLNGLLLEVYPKSNKVHIVGTDGHILGVYRVYPCILESDCTEEKFEVIVPGTLLKNISTKSKTTTINIGEPNCRGGHELSITCDNTTTFTGTSIEGKYPDYRRVIPSELPQPKGDALGQFNIDWLVRFSKVCGILKGSAKESGSGVHIQQGAAYGCAFVHFYSDSNFIGVIMPYRYKNSDIIGNYNKRPDWLE